MFPSPLLEFISTVATGSNPLIFAPYPAPPPSAPSVSPFSPSPHRFSVEPTEIPYTLGIEENTSPSPAPSSAPPSFSSISLGDEDDEELPPETFNPRLQLSVIVCVKENQPVENIARTIRALGTGLIAPQECIIVLYSPSINSVSEPPSSLSAPLETKRKEIDQDLKVRDAIEMCVRGGMQVKFFICPPGSTEFGGRRRRSEIVTAKAKNLGARSASSQSSWLLFLDPDCVPTTNTLAGFVNAVEKSSRLSEEDERIPISVGFNASLGLLQPTDCPSYLFSTSLVTTSSVPSDIITSSPSGTNLDSIRDFCYSRFLPSFQDSSPASSSELLKEILPQPPLIRTALRRRGRRNQSGSVVSSTTTQVRHIESPAYLLGACTLIWRPAFDLVNGYDEGGALEEEVSSSSASTSRSSFEGGLGSELAEDVDLSIRILAKGGGQWRFASGGEEARILVDPRRRNDQGSWSWDQWKRTGMGWRRLAEKYKTSGLLDLRPKRELVQNDLGFFNNNRLRSFLSYLALQSGYETEDRELKEAFSGKKRTCMFFPSMGTWNALTT